jgi:sec-independent protein translocase protein TatC
MFAAGTATCYLVFPKIMEALLGSGFIPHGVAVQLPLDTFLVFYLRMAAVFGLSFVLPLFLVLFNLLGILSANRMLRHWRVVVLAVFVFAAIAVPTGDPIGMSVLATPLCALYFAAVGVAGVNDRRRARLKDADPNTHLSPDQPSNLDLHPAPVKEPEPISRH